MIDESRAYELDRQHVFHSWSAQARISPMVITRAEGSTVWDDAGQGLPRLHLAAGVHQHRPPAPGGRRGDPGAGREAVHGRAAVRQRRPLRGGPADHRAGRRGLREGLLHQRRRRRRRARHPDGPAAHRPHQGALDLPLLPRRHAPRGQRDRRPASLGQRQRLGRHRPLLRPVPLPQRLPRDHRGGGVRPRARAPRAGRGPRGSGQHRRDHPREHPRHGRHHAAAARATSRASARSATGTASSTSPTR